LFEEVDRMKKDIELAKSWFVAAQLSMILAGFLLASAGIVLTNSQNMMSWGLDKVGEVTVQDCSVLENVSNYQEVTVASLDYVQESVRAGLNLYKTFSKYGMALIFLSIIFFWIGRTSLKRLIG